MTLCDVNILVYGHRQDADNHAYYHDYLAKLTNAPGGFVYSTLVLSGFLRIVTHPKVFKDPSPLKQALDFVTVLTRSGRGVALEAGTGHWPIFIDLCRQVQARGNLVPDCYLAALAIEHDCEFATTDRNFSRFPGLRLVYPQP